VTARARTAAGVAAATRARRRTRVASGARRTGARTSNALGPVGADDSAGAAMGFTRHQIGARRAARLKARCASRAARAQGAEGRVGTADDSARAAVRP